MLKEDIDYKKLAEQVMLATDATKIMQEQGVTPPQGGFRTETILGKPFNSSEPDAYLKSVRKPT
jgi:nitrate/nitrite transport system substrate-binding protein